MFCVICGKELIIEGNEMSTGKCDDNDQMITYCHCPYCKTEYEMIDASINEFKYDETYIGSMRLYKNKEETII